MRSGFSLIELSVVLALMGLGVATLLPAARRQTDRMAVLGAREAVVAQLSRTRSEARMSGGASLRIEREGGRLWIESPGPARDTLHLERDHGVGLELGVASATVSFDALGIGRLANRSLTVVRGTARAGLSISAYGRVRRL